MASIEIWTPWRNAHKPHYLEVIAAFGEAYDDIKRKCYWLMGIRRTNRPIVLLGSGLETGHPDHSPALFIHFAMLKVVKILLIFCQRLLCSPVTCSCKNLSLQGRRFLDFSIVRWLFFFFFFERKLCNWRVNLSKGLVTVDRLAQRTVCALTVALEETNIAI